MDKLRPAVFEAGVNIYDISDWPEDVWPALKELCITWGFAPPAFRRSDKKGRGAFWLQSLRSLSEAAAEFYVDDLLREYRKEFVAYMQRHGGLAPHTVVSPASLINAIAGVASRRRLQNAEHRGAAVEDAVSAFFNR